MESGQVYTVVENLCVEDANELDSCDQFLSDYKRLDHFDWIVKIEVVSSVHWDILCVSYYQIGYVMLNTMQLTNFTIASDSADTKHSLSNKLWKVC